jgi:hypothetical protein
MQVQLLPAPSGKRMPLGEVNECKAHVSATARYDERPGFELRNLNSWSRDRLLP